jgi:hypothetical protein
MEGSERERRVREERVFKREMVPNGGDNKQEADLMALHGSFSLTLSLTYAHPSLWSQVVKCNRTS